MSDIASIRALIHYSDQTNRAVLCAAAKLDVALLTQPIDIGLGSLGRILLHVYHGELVWLARWQGKIETGWPSEAVLLPPAEIMSKLEVIQPKRDAFLATVSPELLDRQRLYRDSRGSMFRATLREMILQGVVHSIHHRAQAVNAIRRLGGESLEVDYMVSVRQPATASGV